MHNLLSGFRFAAACLAFAAVPAAAALFFAACSPSTEAVFTLTGEAPSLTDGSTVYLYELGTKSFTDSARVEGHRFTLRGTRPFATRACLYLDSEQITDLFLLERGTLRLEPDADWFRCVGTPMNDAWHRYTAAVQASDGAEEGWAARLRRDSLRNTLAAANRNELGLILLRFALAERPASDVLAALDCFPEAMRRNPDWIDLHDRAAALRADIGKPFIDLCGELPDGTPVSLAQTVARPGNRYVLLHFGASWCSPCRAEMPALVRCYERFHAKGFDCFGVSFDASRSRWLDDLAESGRTWPNICPAPGQSPRSTEAWQAYDLTGIPATFLIDCSDGRILDKRLKGQELYERLEQLLGDPE